MPEQPSVTIPGVPETIKHADYISMLKSIGLDPHQLKELTFGTNAIYAVVIARNAEGRSYIDPNRPNEIATHSIVIRIEN